MEWWNSGEVRSKRLRLRFRCHPEQGEGSPRFFTSFRMTFLDLIVFHPIFHSSKIPGLRIRCPRDSIYLSPYFLGSPPPSSNGRKSSYPPESGGRWSRRHQWFCRSVSSHYPPRSWSHHPDRRALAPFPFLP